MNNQNKIKTNIHREGFSVNEAGKLEFDKCDLTNLSQKYGTPCYVYSESIIRKKCREYIKSFSQRKVNFEILYAGKAFLTKAMCNILKEEGLSLDVASGGELYTALSVGFPPEKIFFHGNNKSKEEIVKKIISVL